ncbi:hypothetical protein TIFTF001_020563 [Ficus carica]|uniref:RNase H type-1 domain-containing protein n=1 Tax=Ficus carica TaxID=3494 RepID=A0AA88ARR1_FICCA|nr:hypothetical protein TIFTF001_020563 [Ficus carica]
MKFPTPNGVGIFRGNQEKARKCYVETMNKVCHKVPQSVVVTIIFKINEIDTLNGEIKPLSGLDPRMSEEETQAQLIEDLVPYHLDPKYPDRIVKSLLDQFRKHIVTQIPRSENSEADALAWLASGIDTEGLVSIPVEHLQQPNIERIEQVYCFKKVKT